MSNSAFRLLSPEPLDKSEPHVPIGRILVDAGLVSAAEVMGAMQLHRASDSRLGDILVAQGLITERQLYLALAQQQSAQFLDLSESPPSRHLMEVADPVMMQKYRLVPWRRIGGLTICATSEPESFAAATAELPAELRRALLGVSTRGDIDAALRDYCGAPLARRAETRVAPELSCCGFGRTGTRLLTALFLVAILSSFFVAPTVAVQGVTLLALVLLFAGATLKTSAFAAAMIARRRGTFLTQSPAPGDGKLPIVSVLVPLNREPEIAAKLVERLGRIRYPRHLLDILLVVEEADDVTRAALVAAQLPSWMRVISVPEGHPRTKPRALNYALDFCRGSIIGVYDAEDAPDPGQIESVVSGFAGAPEDVVCLQAMLDYYNPRDTWLARCFTIEYAVWFRLILPGVRRLGLPIPLGGTSLFFRRAALEALGGWDAHNVTEDADLGIRLARRGWRTELVASVTQEEANCHIWPWIKQRSRWLKGYMLTYAVHMRRPWRLLSDLGPWRFLGFQVFFLSTLSQFLLAPLVWALLFAQVGGPHAVVDVIGTAGIATLAVALISVEVMGLIVGAVAVAGRYHRHLWPWLPTLPFYFAIGAAAAAKALAECILDPFYWDKTQHGHSLDEGKDAPAARADQPLASPGIAAE